MRPYLSGGNTRTLPIQPFKVLTSVMDRGFALSETSEGMGHVGAGHARGKTTITVFAPAVPGPVTEPRLAHPIAA